MPETEISIDNNDIFLHTTDGNKYYETIENLDTLYCLFVGSDVQANDSTCYILMFKDDMWIVPDSIKGVYALKKWAEFLSDKNKIVMAQIDYLPFSWRRKRFLFGLEAKLAIKKKSEIKNIENKLCVIDKSQNIYA